jgi:hypothetical protein
MRLFAVYPIDAALYLLVSDKAAWDVARRKV